MSQPTWNRYEVHFTTLGQTVNGDPAPNRNRNCFTFTLVNIEEEAKQRVIDGHKGQTLVDVKATLIER